MVPGPHEVRTPLLTNRRVLDSVVRVFSLHKLVSRAYTLHLTQDTYRIRTWPSQCYLAYGHQGRLSKQPVYHS